MSAKNGVFEKLYSNKIFQSIRNCMKDELLRLFMITWTVTMYIVKLRIVYFKGKFRIIQI